VRDIVIGRSPLLNRQPHCGPEYLWIIVPERFLNEGREAGAKNQEKESLSQGIGQGADHAPGGREHRGDPLLGRGIAYEYRGIALSAKKDSWRQGWRLIDARALTTGAAPRVRDFNHESRSARSAKSWSSSIIGPQYDHYSEARDPSRGDPDPNEHRHVLHATV
jgi:hypothetical protein